MIIEHKLPNGITIIGEKMPYSRAVSLGVWIGSGSTRENANQAGIAHLIEHMMLKGTTTRSAEALASEVDFYGGQLNAFTAKECTQYCIKSTDDKLEKSMEILGDVFNNPAILADDLEREKGVVLEEISMVEDTPDDVVIENLVAKFFEGSNLGKPILGTAKSVSGFTRDDLFAFINENYVASNTVIAAAGNFDEQQLFELGEKYFGNCRQGTSLPKIAPPPPSKKALVTKNKTIEQMNIALALPGFANEDDRFIPMLILTNALGGNMSSRLFQVIREQRGLAYSVYAFASSYTDTGMMVLYAATGNAQGKEVFELMLKELRSVAKDGLTDEEFLRNKNQLRASYILSMESATARMNGIGKARVLKDKVRSEDEIIAMIDKATQDDVRAILPEILDLSALTASFVGDIEKLGEVENLW